MLKVFLLICLLISPSAFADVFQGNVHCAGPYMQPQLNLPSNAIQIDVKWDPLFRNSDLRIIFKSSKVQQGVALLNSYTSSSYPQEFGFQSTVMKFNGHLAEVWLNSEERGGKIETARLIVDGHNHYILQCL